MRFRIKDNSTEMGFVLLPSFNNCGRGLDGASEWAARGRNTLRNRRGGRLNQPINVLLMF